MRTALTIAGSDSSGGAGIQADIKTMSAHGVYAMSAVTALTAQNTTGVFGIMEVTPEFLEKQLNCIFEDIPPDAVKIGMLPSQKLMEVVERVLLRYPVRHVVLDPVMVSTSGSPLMARQAISFLQKRLFPLAEVITPNLPEAEALTGIAINGDEAQERAAEQLSRAYGCAVLCKGGHRAKDANDLLYSGGRAVWIRGKHIPNPNTHGTGCTLSSAIACNLASGYPLEKSVRRAKEYLAGALSAQLQLGKGPGPLDHSFAIQTTSGSLE